MVFRRLTFALPLLFFFGCAPPATVVEEPAQTPPEPAQPAYETFDPAPFRVEPRSAPVAVEVQHDVPERLMDGRLPEVPEMPAAAVVQGFRIQLFTSASKASADAVRDDVVAWWQRVQHHPDIRATFEYGLHPVVVFGTPFFRVRVGLFPDRQRAAAALAILRERYPEAFIVPDIITLVRE